MLLEGFFLLSFLSWFFPTWHLGGCNFHAVNKVTTTSEMLVLFRYYMEFPESSAALGTTV